MVSAYLSPSIAIRQQRPLARGSFMMKSDQGWSAAGWGTSVVAENPIGPGDLTARWIIVHPHQKALSGGPEVGHALTINLGHPVVAPRGQEFYNRRY